MRISDWSSDVCSSDLQRVDFNRAVVCWAFWTSPHMPPPLLRTHMIKSILHHALSLGYSQRRCAQALGVSKGVVAKYVTAATAAGLDWSDIEPMSDPAPQTRLVPPRLRQVAPAPPGFARRTNRTHG